MQNLEKASSKSVRGFEAVHKKIRSAKTELQEIREQVGEVNRKQSVTDSFLSQCSKAKAKEVMNAVSV